MAQGDLRIVSGLEISYINQDTSHLSGTVHSFCMEHQLEESLLCSILRQLENLILKYQPTMLVVDHDVRFREKIATKTVWL